LSSNTKEDGDDTDDTSWTEDWGEISEEIHASFQTG
jgi:hypothetical protein